MTATGDNGAREGISSNSKITIGLVIAILGGVGTPIWTQATLTARVESLEKQVGDHIKEKAHRDAERRLAIIFERLKRLPKPPGLRPNQPGRHEEQSIDAGGERQR